MKQMNVTQVQKHQIHGEWEANTYIPLGPEYDNEDGMRVLKVHTYKAMGRNKIVTDCRVWSLSPDGIGEVTVFFQDYQQKLDLAEGRCTEKNVKASHDRGLMLVPEFLEAAKAHCLAQAAKEVA